jgi:hypothetical protein
MQAPSGKKSRRAKHQHARADGLGLILKVFIEDPWALVVLATVVATGSVIITWLVKR